MALIPAQRQVIKGMASGMAISISVLLAAAFLGPVMEAQGELTWRLAFVLKLEIATACWLVLSIGLLARHRFFNPEDIDAHAVSTGSEKAAILQANLQNTLEQSVLAVLVHLIWASYMPARYLFVLVAAVALFIVGRILFLNGYAGGAGSRAVGFAMTFYPSVLLLAAILARCLAMLVGTDS